MVPLFPQNELSYKDFGTRVAGTRHNLSGALTTNHIQQINGLETLAAQRKGQPLTRPERFVVALNFFLKKLQDGSLTDSNVIRGWAHLRAARIDAYVYVDFGNPEAWIADLAERTLSDIHLFHAGQKIESHHTVFGRLKGLKEDPQRAASAQLATIIESMVEAADQGSDRDKLKDAVRWNEVEQLAGRLGELTALLDALVGQLVSQMDGNEDEPFDRVGEMNPLSRAELGRQMLSVLPTTESGRKYLITVINIDTSDANLTDKEKRLARSPVHPDQVEGVLKAFQFNVSTWDVEPVEGGVGFWGPIPDTASIEDLVNKSTSAGKTALKIYGTYCSAAVAAMQLSQVQHQSLGANPNVARRLKLLITRDVNWPKPAEQPVGAKTKSIAVVKGLFAAVTLFNKVEAVGNSSEVTNAELLALANAVNGLIGSAAGVGKAFSGSSKGTASAKLVSRMSLHVTISLSVVDIALSLKAAFDAERMERMMAHGAAAAAAGVTTTTALFASLRTVPHPATFVVGLVGMAMASGVGWWLADIELRRKAELLRHTRFGKDGLLKRIAWTKDVSSSTSDGEGFEDLRYAMLMSSGGGEEDYARQIAILLGAMGAFGLDWSEDFFIGEDRVEIQTTRKLRGYIKNSVFHNDDLDKTLLPAESTLDIYDATHGRGANATTLGDSAVDSRLPLLLTRPNSQIAEPLRDAANQILNQEEWKESIALNGLNMSDRVEAVLTTQSPAWRASAQERAAGRDDEIPRARVIVRDKL